MKWILAPDSFKNCLRAPQVAANLAAGIRQAAPDDEIVELPLADGGEGTAEAAAAAAGGALESLEVTGPLGTPVQARYARLRSGTIVIEMAEAAGLELLPAERRDPLVATTFGVGELFSTLLKRGERDFVFALGGSATCDGGLGFLQALGANCFDAAGNRIATQAGGGRLEEIATLDLSQAVALPASVKVRIASDVTNPLTGNSGAARIFAPQKGAPPAAVEQLERGLRHWAELWNDAGDIPGDGAAGGIGFLLRKYCRAEICSGAELLLDMAGFDRRLPGADWVVTGEGRTDRQSLDGKLCSVVAKRAARFGVRTILCSGALSPDLGACDELFTAAFSIGNGPETLEQAISHTPENLRRIGRNLARLLHENRKTTIL